MHFERFDSFDRSCGVSQLITDVCLRCGVCFNDANVVIGCSGMQGTRVQFPVNASVVFSVLLLIDESS